MAQYNRKHALPSAKEVGESEYNRLYYRTVAQEGIRKRAHERFVVRKAFVDWLKSLPCLDCKKTWPSYVLDFDHRPGADKKFRISRWVSGEVPHVVGGCTIEALQAEVQKCDLVCSNCHRIRTHDRIRVV